ncbi:hypothetical protein KN815_47150 [Streptomyces sp. 4503]|uniref:Uncharacterized protein n=1 Tax=Streptomyces niphimycinicus TaxID=2842201 RepID=A0ABS6CX35_9ACTN|nr:hypothetical protein [Streptomyces niphimycinicus]MBU3871360.1 hypothetical protein [Streptomyces niphimycinicus]
MSAGELDPIGSDARGPVIVAFLVFIGLSLLWLFMLASSQEHEPERLYIADRSLSPVFNGFAMTGEQITVVTLLVTSEFIARYGYDGFSIAIDLMLALGVLLLPRVALITAMASVAFLAALTTVSSVVWPSSSWSP